MDTGIVSGDTTAAMGDGDGDSNGDGDADPDTGEGEEDTTTGPPVCEATFPYMGNWDVGCCQDEIQPQNGWAPGGVGVGTIMPDYYFTDQFGEEIRLYDFCHDAVWFEYVALW